MNRVQRRKRIGDALDEYFPLPNPVTHPATFRQMIIDAIDAAFDCEEPTAADDRGQLYARVWRGAFATGYEQAKADALDRMPSTCPEVPITTQPEAGEFARRTIRAALSEAELRIRAQARFQMLGDRTARDILAALHGESDE